jgi:UDP-3-O-[3-hydroxymyristoyl] N-acetylglucosamine deacetylase
MNNLLQGTLSQIVSFSGAGLHTGKKAHITLHPAAVNTGIVFRRTDKAGQGVEIPAHWQYTKELPLCTCISLEGVIHVRTIEHLMAAFYACGIDNVRVDVAGTELPILDGSAIRYIEGLEQAGVCQQDISRPVFQVTRRLEFSEGATRTISIEPADHLSLDITISLAKIGRLNWCGEMNPALFKQEAAKARTFGRLKNGLLAQLTRFNKDPICLGANTKSAVVIVGDKAINKGGLRMPDEYILHRVLDLVGDLMLSGGHIQGKITASSTAHRLNHGLLRAMFAEGGGNVKQLR